MAQDLIWRIQTVYEKLFGVRDDWLEHASDASRMVSVAVFLGVMAGLVFLAGRHILRGDAVRAFWYVAALIVAVCLMTGGVQDTQIHIYRVAAFAAQIRDGVPSLMLVDPVSGEALPIFVFYSPLPYLFPVLLDLAGLPAALAYRIALGAYFCVFAIGVHRLTAERARALDPAPATEAAFLCAILFVTAAYIAGNWAVRSAFAELVVLSLLPWAIRFLIAGAGWKLAFVLAAQMATHPIVFPQAFLGMVLLGIALSDRSPAALTFGLIVPTLGALALSAPFWAPQVLWESAIGGTASTPFRFKDSFLSVASLLNPLNHLAMGPWILVALALLLFRSRRLASWRGWMLGVTFLVSIAMQTEIFRPITMSLPFVERGLFIWRMMSLSALLGFGLLLLGSRYFAVWPLRLIACASIVNLAVMVMAMTGHKIALTFAVVPDAAYIFEYPKYNTLAYNLGWGFSEFYPNYKPLPNLCPALEDGQAERVSFAAARNGVPIQRTMLTLPRGPYRFVRYDIGAEAVDPAGACGDLLVFGPLARPGVFHVDETWIEQLFWLRLVIGFVIIGGMILATRPWRMSGHPRPG